MKKKNSNFFIFIFFFFIIFLKFFYLLVQSVENIMPSYPQALIHKSFTGILSNIKIENCKSAKENCSEFVKKYILDFNSKLKDFHWIYKSERFPKLLLNRIRIKEECRKLKETGNN